MNVLVDSIIAVVYEVEKSLTTGVPYLGPLGSFTFGYSDPCYGYCSGSDSFLSFGTVTYQIDLTNSFRMYAYFPFGHQ